MQSAVIKKLQELNQTHRTDCKVKFIDAEESYYYQGVITLGLETKDPVWTLCHEFKHFLQDSKKSYLYLLKHKIIKRTILNTIAVVLGYYLVVQVATSGADHNSAVVTGAQIGMMIYLFLFSLLLYAPLIGAMQELYKDLNHHLEYEADRFATKHSGVIPYESQVVDEESVSHPSWNSRIITLEAEFPSLKIKGT